MELNERRSDYKELHNKFDELNANLIRSVTAQEGMLQKLNEHSETLYGNGQPGLRIKVDRLESLPKKVEGLEKGIEGVGTAKKIANVAFFAAMAKWLEQVFK